MTKKLSLLAAAIATALFISPALASALGAYSSGTTGVDVSYPNCATSIPKTAFGIVGVTRGLFYSYNGCLASEASNFQNPGLYTNTGWYDQSTRINASSPLTCAATDANCLAYNYGYNAALDSLNYAKSQGVSSTTWWLDVETANSWNSNVSQNRSSLQGSYDALKNNGAQTVGAYSTTAQWQGITGGWLNSWPNWGATTWTSTKQAAKYCTGHNFTGGPTYLIQYSGRNLDLDYAC